MVLDERSRHQLFVRLEEVLGAAEASTLMEHLPPVGWADVATKRDLEHVVGLLRGDIGSAKNELLAEFHQALAAQGRHLITVMTAVMSALTVTLAGLAFAAARLV